MGDITRCNYCILLDLRRKYRSIELRPDPSPLWPDRVKAIAPGGEYLATFMALPDRCAC